MPGITEADDGSVNGWYAYKCNRCGNPMGLRVDLGDEEVPCFICGRGAMKRYHKPKPTPPATAEALKAGHRGEKPSTPGTKLEKVSHKKYPPGTPLQTCRYCGEEFDEHGIISHEAAHKRRGHKPVLTPVSKRQPLPQEEKPAPGIAEQPGEKPKKEERDVREHNEQFKRQ